MRSQADPPGNRLSTRRQTALLRIGTDMIGAADARELCERLVATLQADAP